MTREPGQNNRRGAGQDFVARQKTLCVAGISAGFQHRMADEMRVHAVGGKKFGLKRQQTQQLIPQPGEFFHPLLPPGPHLGGDVVDAFYPEAFYGFQDAQREARAVYCNQHIGPCRGDGGDGLVNAAPQRQYFGQNFGQAHQRQLLHGKKRGEPRFGHAGAADAQKFKVRV